MSLILADKSFILRLLENINIPKLRMLIRSKERIEVYRRHVFVFMLDANVLAAIPRNAVDRPLMIVKELILSSTVSKSAFELFSIIFNFAERSSS